MSVSGRISGAGYSTAQSISQIRAEIDDLSRQLSTGKRAQSLSEMGSFLSKSIDLRSRLARLSVYDDAITNTNMNIDSRTNVIKSFSEVSNQVEINSLNLSTAPEPSNRTTVRTNVRRQFSQLVDYLNTELNGTYLFGGKESGSAPVLDANLILDGGGGKAGLSQYISERQAADLGANGQGRLQVSSTGSVVSFGETVPGSLFGFTLKGVTSQDPGITLGAPTGTPPQATVSLNAQPAAGSTITVTLGLPDGSTMDVTLTAAGGAGTNGFAIGATTAQTAGNIATALQSALQTAGKIQLAAASAKSAALDFFKGSSTNPPRRVAGPPYDSATNFVAGNANNTVLWYQGTDDTNDPRDDVVAKISERLSLAFGARANEVGFAETLAGTAIMAVTNFSTTDEPLAKQQFSEMRDRARSIFAQAKTDVTSTNVSLINAQTIAKTNSNDQKSEKAIYETALANGENVPLEQTAVSLTSLQTQLQALYQLTAKLQSLSLANYI